MPFTWKILDSISNPRWEGLYLKGGRVGEGGTRRPFAPLFSILTTNDKSDPSHHNGLKQLNNSNIWRHNQRVLYGSAPELIDVWYTKNAKKQRTTERMMKKKRMTKMPKTRWRKMIVGEEGGRKGIVITSICDRDLKIWEAEMEKQRCCYKRLSWNCANIECQDDR